MSSKSSSSPHPTAKALFAAFGANSSKHKHKHQSEFIRKQAETLGWRCRHSQSEFYPITIQQTEIHIQQVQRGEVENTYGTGATVWPASIVLCKYMELHPLLLVNKSVVDLGAGTGVTSVVAAMLGAKSVMCTDGCDKVVELARSNVNRVCAAAAAGATATSIGLGYPIDVCQYWWGDGTIPTKCNVILVADCVLPKLYPIAPLVAAIDDLLDVDGVAILSYEHRYYPDYDPRVHFVELAKARNLVVETIPLVEHDPVYSVEDIEIWKVRRGTN